MIRVRGIYFYTISIVLFVLIVLAIASVSYKIIVFSLGGYLLGMHVIYCYLSSKTIDFGGITIKNDNNPAERFIFFIGAIVIVFVSIKSLF